MGQSYRVKTKVGFDQTINVQLDQDFEFLEILSLSIQQSELYNRNCANYGVLVGRVTANNGYGIPNARVSIFIPIDSIDESNPIITSIYPYKSPQDKNEDGYRYNLLPYEKSYSEHSPTGTFPSKLDIITGQTASNIYDKYYRYTCKTNDSGDYMIMGVPLGTQTIVMDVDLSDIGEFSLTPQDLIRLGLTTENEVSGNKFRSSSDIDSLPQIINVVKTIEISPLWGDVTTCQIAINRVDFDLRDDVNIDINPTSIFMGSLFSSSDENRIRPNCSITDSLGNLCELTTGTGQILSIRQTIFQDEDGNYILENYDLAQSGNVIDGDGTWVVDIPMNLDYVTTNEFGEQVISNDPSIGIPTKAKYRFKIKWTQPPTLTEQSRRAYFLVPNIKEYGWTDSFSDPTFSSNQNNVLKQQSSYYFGLDWTGYTQGFIGDELEYRNNELINCEDTFYEFKYNRVYTVSGLIDQYKNGLSRGKFIGIKEVDDNSCSSLINKFPVNDGFRNFDLLYFIFSILFIQIQFIGIPLLIIYHLLAFSWNISILRFIVNFKFPRIKLPMISYPNCESCNCDEDSLDYGSSVVGKTIMSQLSNSNLYLQSINSIVPKLNNTSFYDPSDSNQFGRVPIISQIFSESVAGRTDDPELDFYKTMKSQILRFPDNNNQVFAQSKEIPFGERINVFNTRKKFFDNVNRIKVSFDTENNGGLSFDVPNPNYHLDNTLTVLFSEKIESGTMMTFVNPDKSSDVNFLTKTVINNDVIQGITGTSKIQNSGTITVNYVNPDNPLTNLSKSYNLSYGSNITNYQFPSDIEYYQVVTAITVSDAMKIWNYDPNLLSDYFPYVLSSTTVINYNQRQNGWGELSSKLVRPIDLFRDGLNQYITIIQRGVDPYSPKYNNQYRLGKLFGYDDDDSIILTASTRLNIPIQRINDSNSFVQNFNEQNDIFYSSYFFEPGTKFSSFTTNNVGYYGKLDRSYAMSNIPQYTTTNLLSQNVRLVVSKTNNDSYLQLSSTSYYSLSDDLGGGSYFFSRLNKNPNKSFVRYYSPSLLPQFTGNPMNVSVKTKNIIRTDRLPSSDYLDGSSWKKNVPLLQENLGFSVYVLNTNNNTFTVEPILPDASIQSPDISGQVAGNQVLNSFNCQNMVGLNCYTGDSTNFGIDPNCESNVKNGCYILVERPILDLFKDLRSYTEWGYRFRFFYGLCRGVLSQTFVNNWVNGSLFAYPIQINTYYDLQNNPLPPVFCNSLVYFDSGTNNFYYRSSPYHIGTNSFVGKFNSSVTKVNNLNLQYPVTILNLGFKRGFYSELTLNPDSNYYIINRLSSTSYSDMSDLINLFVISRITNSGFFSQLFSGISDSLNKLFSRDGINRRIDGDLAQLMSINSEEGVVKFSPEYYQSNNISGDPVRIFNSNTNYPIIGVWYSSTTENLQFKDNVSPGRINFRTDDNLNNYPFYYGIKSQEVPFYRWKINVQNLPNQVTIFGSQLNNWDTTLDGIFSWKYQSQDRLLPAPDSYFWSNTTPTNNDTYRRGYIFSVNSNGAYSENGLFSDKFLVGAPYHFYFGIKKGNSALDKFKTKYLSNE